MRRAPLALVAIVLSGCASTVWDRRNLDCRKDGSVFVRADYLDIETADPDVGDVCTIELQGLGGADVDRTDDGIDIYDPRRVLLRFMRSRPPTEVRWSRQGHVSVDLDALSIRLDTQIGAGSGTITWSADGDLVEFWLETAQHLDQLQIDSLGDVTLHLADESYRLVLDVGPDPELGGYGNDPDGPLILVNTEGHLTIDGDGG